MLSLLILAFVGYVIYCYINRDRAETRSRGGVFTKMSDARGALGERAIQKELARILPTICGNDFYLHSGPAILLHAPGTAYPSAEIDHLVITQFGVFVIETKHWSGRVRPSPSLDHLIRISPSGLSETRKSPLAQNRTKVAFLQKIVSGMGCPVRSVGVFAAPNCTLEGDLHPDLIYSSDLPQWLVAQRDLHLSAGFERLSISVLTNRILSACDLSHDAEARHRATVMR